MPRKGLASANEPTSPEGAKAPGWEPSTKATDAPKQVAQVSIHLRFGWWFKATSKLEFSCQK